MSNEFAVNTERTSCNCELYLMDATKVSMLHWTSTPRLSNHSGLRLAKVFAHTLTHTHTVWSCIWAAGQVINIYISTRCEVIWYLYLSDTLLRRRCRLRRRSPLAANVDVDGLKHAWKLFYDTCGWRSLGPAQSQDPKTKGERERESKRAGAREKMRA